MTIAPVPAEPVRFNVLSHRLVGSFLATLAGAAARPERLSSFMTALAEHVDAVLKLPPKSMDARYVDGCWRLPGVLEVFSVDRDAVVDYTQDMRERIMIRLPDKALLDEARAVADAFDRGQGAERIYVDRFYYDFLKGGADALSNGDFLDCRIADYAFSKCR